MQAREEAAIETQNRTRGQVAHQLPNLGTWLSTKEVSEEEGPFQSVQLSPENTLYLQPGSRVVSRHTLGLKDMRASPKLTFLVLRATSPKLTQAPQSLPEIKV